MIFDHPRFISLRFHLYIGFLLYFKECLLALDIPDFERNEIDIIYVRWKRAQKGICYIFQLIYILNRDLRIHFINFIIFWIF